MDSIVSEENVQMILGMGFPSESEVRRALRMAKNDLGDAVAILTNEPPTAPYEHMDIDLKEGSSGPSSTSYGPHLPPTYDEVCNETGQNKVNEHEIKISLSSLHFHPLFIIINLC